MTILHHLPFHRSVLILSAWSSFLCCCYVKTSAATESSSSSNYAVTPPATELSSILSRRLEDQGGGGGGPSERDAYGTLCDWLFIHGQIYCPQRKKKKTTRSVCVYSHLNPRQSCLQKLVCGDFFFLTALSLPIFLFFPVGRNCRIGCLFTMVYLFGIMLCGTNLLCLPEKTDCRKSYGRTTAKLCPDARI
jgi:hypothetical protein